MTGSTAATRPVPAPRTRDLSSSTSTSPLDDSGDVAKKKRKPAAPPPPTASDHIVETVLHRSHSDSSRTTAETDMSETVETRPEPQELTFINNRSSRQAPAVEEVKAAPTAAVRSNHSSTGARAKLRLLLGRKPSSSTSATRGTDAQQQQPRVAATQQQQQSLLAVVAINSTLVNSTASLPRAVDISPVRPPSALSNCSSAASTATSAATIRTMHKKRRAPPPPVLPPPIRKANQRFR